MKKVAKMTSVALLTGAMFLASCCRSGQENLVNPVEAKKGDVTFHSTIGSLNRVSNETEWDAGDAIGVYAVKANHTLTVANLHENQGNVKYTTADASGRFVAATQGIKMPESGAVDFVAYYPYTTAANNSTTIAFNTQNQSNLSKIDLLYSNNAKGKTSSDPKVALHFEHKLSMVVLDITTNGTALTGTPEVKLEDVTVDGTLDLATGTVTAGSTKGAPVQKIVEVQAGQRYQAIFILTPQSFTGKKLQSTINGKKLEETLGELDAKSNFKYTIPTTYTKSGEIFLDTTNATIEEWNDGSTTDPIILNPEAGTTPTPTPTPPTTTPPTTSAKLLFPGADFEDWVTFTAGLNEYKLKDKDYATQSPNGKVGKAMHINGTPKGNDFVFTTTAKDTPTSAKKIKLFIKGTAGKSISFNVYKANGKFEAFNLDAIGAKGHTVTPSDAPVVLEKANKFYKGNGSNSYAQGKIDTKGEWLEITLNVEGIDLATSGNFFALKVGKDVAYDLYIDEITFE